jgi:putative membrane protein
LWHIKFPLLINMIIAVLVTADQIRRYHGYSLMLPDLADEIVFNSFRLITFVMALLMAFRINRTYDRWWLGRQSFAGVGNAGVALSMQAMQWVPDGAIRAEIRRWCKIWHYSILQICRGDKFLDPAAAALMSDEELQEYHSSRKGRNLVVIYLRRLIYIADIRSVERHQMEAVVQAGVSAMGTCSRLKFQCTPYSLSLICTGFLQVFLMFLPIAVIKSSTSHAYDEDHPIFGLVIYSFTCVLMLGVDEVANQLEQPFPHMPMVDIVDTTIRDIDRLPKECSALGKLQDTALEKQRARLNSSSNGMVTDATIQGTADAQSNISKEVPDTKHGLVEACLQKPPNQQTVGDAAVITMNPA